MSNVMHGAAMDVALAIVGAGTVTLNLYILYFWHRAKKSRTRSTSTHQS
jgi:hypothetical protein